MKLNLKMKQFLKKFKKFNFSPNNHVKKKINLKKSI